MSGTRSDVRSDVRADARADEGVGGILYGMWFDGVNDKVLFDGTHLDAKTKGRITGTFHTTSTGSVCICAATDESAVYTSVRISIILGKFTFAVSDLGADLMYAKSVASYNDGLAHTFEVKVTDSETLITIDGVLLGASDLVYVVGSASSHLWFSAIPSPTLDMFAIGFRQDVYASTHEPFLGVVSDIKIYDENFTTALGNWAGHGTTDADWLDKGPVPADVAMWWDNVDDKVTAATPAGTVDVKMKVTSSLDTHGILLADSAASNYLLASGYGSGASISNGSGTPSFTVDGTSLLTQGQLWNALADGLEHEVVATGADLSSWTSMYIGNYTSGGASVWEGVIRDVRVYNSSTGALIHQYIGNGNTNADWEDQVGSNDGTVSGTPSRRFKTTTVWREANNGTVSGSPSRAISTDSGVTWAMETASDSDAAAYITLLGNAGTSVSPTQISALDTFFLTGKSQGWYSALKRMYLPIWAAAGPNALCLVSSTSGTFSGSVTHGAGFVTGDGSSSYFNVGATPSALGIATGDALIMRGIHIDGSDNHDACGVAQTSSLASLALLNFAAGHASEGTTYFRQPSGTAQVEITGQGTEYRGIYLGSCTATDARFLHRRRSGGVTVVASTVSDTQAIYDHAPLFLARNLNGTASNRTDGSEFAWALGTGMTQAQATDFTAALETMWETCTGLTLF